MITEREPIHHELKLPKIVCDVALDEKRKQLKEPLPNCNHTTLFIGKPRSGKSSLAFSMIATKKQAYYRLFSKIFIVIPPSSLSSLSVKDIKNHKRVYDDLSLETLDAIEKETDELNEKGKEYHSLVIYDDVGSQIKSDHTLEQKLKASSWNFRHKARSTWYLLQTYRSLSLGIRKVATHLFLFKLSQLELELVHTELILWLDKKGWLDVCRHVFGHGKHTSMFIDLDVQSIYRVTDNKYYEIVL